MDTHTSSPYFASAGPPASTMSSSLLLLRPRPPPARTLDCLSRFARFAASKTEPLIQHTQPRPFPTFESDTSQQTQSSSSAPIDTPPATPTPLPSPSSVSPHGQTPYPQALPTIRAFPSCPSSSLSSSSSFSSSCSSSSSTHPTQASHAPKRAQPRSPAKSEQQSHTQTREYMQPESPPRKRISTSPRKTSPKAQTHDSYPPASSGATQEPPIPLPPFKFISDRQSARAFMSAVRGLFVSRATPSTSGRQDPMPNFGCGLLFDGIDPNSESPVVKGNVYGISIYGGPDWSHDDAPITILDFRSKGVFEETRDFLASQKYRKAFHNMSVCTHLIHRLDHTITNGIVADTMHMARLHDTGLESYKLRSLSKRYLPSSMTSLLPLRETRGQGRPSLASVDKTQQQYRDSADPYRAVEKDEDTIEECPIEMYQKPKERKDQAMDVLLDEEPYRQQILEFAATDAYLTWHLHSYMCEQLSKSPWVLFDQKKNGNMHQFYVSTWLPFGILLTDMERRGVKVDTQLLKKMETQAVEAKFMNISSPQQKSFLLFGNGEKSFLVDNVDNVIEPGKKKPLKKKTIILKGLGLKPTSGQSPDDSKSANHEHASTGASILKALAGNPNAKEPNYGHLEDQLPKEDAAVASHAIHALLKRTSVSTLLQTFIIPLQELAAKTSNHRIHTSLNLQTQTGRLSSRHPNLQNQPSYGKDKYGIRRAFIPERGNKFIIADYSQLELRLLAHLTDCRSMIDAFKAGGDFHSRTAVGMYPYIASAISSGQVLLEDKKSADGSPAVPLLKDIYASERQKAKQLNFSIAYGKTSFGLAKDWMVSLDEAETILDAWYRDRPEVKKWQAETKKNASRQLKVPTMVGRHRNLKKESGWERMAINAPIQGSAADLVVQAMIRLDHDIRLREWDWRLILQVHDEVILEGPEEHAEEAIKVVKEIMEHPWNKGFFRFSPKIQFSVSPRIASMWASD